MKQVKVVIGANFGDEGKGLLTDYFAAEAKKRGERCLVVCHNGGPQRGHTVETLSGIRHIFHHFGAGAFSGADTYLEKNFLINPIFYWREKEELAQKKGNTTCFMHPDCQITIPYDMLLNQRIEQERGTQKHGSCGMGIYETIVRNQKKESQLTIGLWRSMSQKEKWEFFHQIRSEYFMQRIKKLNLSLAKEEKEILFNEYLIENFIEDMNQMIKQVPIYNTKILLSYDTIIFEGAQGLLLDQNRKEGMPHLTPSNTGSKNPCHILRELTKLYKERIDVEFCYVTRTYLTRHGAGDMEFECKKEEINSDMYDETNVKNPYQDTLRYGWIDKLKLQERICMDIPKERQEIKVSLAVTHTNETKGMFAERDGNKKIEAEYADKIYISNNRTKESIKVKENMKQ